MSNVLTPNAKQQFFDNNGRPAVGYQLFTYAAGTTTKLDTYVSESGAANTNPIVLDYRGECNLWIPPNVSYKYVLAPPSDTDPPTAPIWTVDDLVSSQLITLYGGVDTGSVNAYVLNFTANFSAYADGIFIYWIPSNTNTGPSTINVNGLGVVAIVDPNGTALGAGAILANQVTSIFYKGGQFILTSFSVVAGSFVGTLTGMTTTVTGTINYRVVAGICTLYVTANRTGTSNANTFTVTGLPDVVLPLNTSFYNAMCGLLRDNGADIVGAATIVASTSTMTLYAGANASGFSGAGQKGLPAGWTVSYPL